MTYLFFLLVVLLTVSLALGLGAHCLRPAKVSSFWLGFFLGPIGMLITAVMKISDGVEHATADNKAQAIVDQEMEARRVRDNILFCSVVVGSFWLLLGLVTVSKYALDKQRQAQLEGDVRAREHAHRLFVIETEERRKQEQEERRRRQEEERVLQAAEVEKQWSEEAERAALRQQQWAESQQVVTSEELEQQERVRVASMHVAEFQAQQHAEREALRRQQEQEAQRLAEIRDAEIVEQLAEPLRLLQERVTGFGEPAARDMERIDALVDQGATLQTAASEISDKETHAELLQQVAAVYTAANALLDVAADKQRKWEQYALRTTEQQQEAATRWAILQARREAREKQRARELAAAQAAAEKSRRVITTLGREAAVK